MLLAQHLGNPWYILGKSLVNPWYILLGAGTENGLRSGDKVSYRARAGPGTQTKAHGGKGGWGEALNE